MSEMLTKEQLLRAFDLAYTQRTTIDAKKCESFGDMMQGFFALKDGDNARLIPFLFYDEKTLAEVREAVGTFSTAYLGVSFVQHYIHYS